MSSSVWLPISPYAWRWTPGLAVAAAATGAATFAWTNGVAGFGATTVSLLAALPIAFGVDEPMAATLAASPTSLRERTFLRLSVLLSGVLAVWAVALVAAVAHDRDVTVRPLECVVLTLLVTAPALAATRRRPDGGAAYFAVAVSIGAVLVATQVPPPLAMYPVEDLPGRWLALGGILVALAGWATRDPAAHRRR